MSVDSFQGAEEFKALGGGESPLPPATAGDEAKKRLQGLRAEGCLDAEVSFLLVGM